MYRNTVEFDPPLSPSGEDTTRRRVAVGKCRKRAESSFGAFTFDGISLWSLKQPETEVFLYSDANDKKSQGVRIIPELSGAISTSPNSEHREKVEMLLNGIFKRFLKA